MRHTHERRVHDMHARKVHAAHETPAHYCFGGSLAQTVVDLSRSEFQKTNVSIEIDRKAIKPLTSGERLLRMLLLRRIDSWIVEVLDDLPSTGRFCFVVFASDISASEDREKEFGTLYEKLYQKDSVVYRYGIDLANDPVITSCQQSHNPGLVPSLDGLRQRPLRCRILRVGVDLARRQQRRHHRLVPSLSGPRQRRLALCVLRVGVDPARRQQRRHHRLVPSPGGP
jgi:hypothetical protein